MRENLLELKKRKLWATMEFHARLLYFREDNRNKKSWRRKTKIWQLNAKKKNHGKEKRKFNKETKIKENLLELEKRKLWTTVEFHARLLYFKSKYSYLSKEEMEKMKLANLLFHI